MLDVNDALSQRLPEREPERVHEQRPRYDRDAILNSLQATSYLWVPAEFPQGKIDHVKRVVRCADITGRPPRDKGSCVIELDGEHAGSYRDWSNDQQGDAIGTIADHFGVDGLDALKKAAEIAEQYGGRVHTPVTDRATARKKAEDNLKEAESALLHSVPAVGTLVENYFASRGLQLPATEDLRYNDSLTFWEKGQAPIGLPAMVANVRYPDGEPTGGIHRVYLRDDGSGYIEKKMIGPVDGGVVMLAPMSADGTLGVAEGIETAAAAMQMFRVPCWSTLSSGGLRKLGAWIAEKGPGNVKHLIIFADRGPDGESAAETLRAAASAAGIQAEVRLPQGGDDFNDDLQKGLFPMDGGIFPAPELLPPATAVSVDDLQKDAEALKAGSDPRGILRQMAGMILDPVASAQLIETIRLHTRLPKDAIKEQYKMEQRSLGVGSKMVGQSGGKSWLSKAVLGDNGPLPIMGNVALALREDREWQGVLGFNEFTGWVTLRQPPPWLTQTERQVFTESPWTDADGRQATNWMQMVAGVCASSLTVFEAVAMVAEENPFHPVRDYLDSLVWDGKPRLNYWLATYLGAAPEPLDKDLAGADKEADRKRYDAQVAYIEAIGARWMIGAVRRIYQPGCKSDCALILIGPQGLLKSTVFSVLGSPWFTDQVPDLKTKDAAIQLAGVWIVEFAELTSFRSTETNTVKSWMSRSTDRYRAPYGRQPADYPRQCCFGGTTNDHEFLHDPTGARRFWSVVCGEKIDIEALRRDRDQLWAEAVHRCRVDEPHWLDTDDLNQAAAAEAEKHYAADPWEQPIRDWLMLTKKTSVFTGTVLEDAIKKPKSDWGRADEMRVATCLRRLGWTKGKQVWSREHRGQRPFTAPDGWLE